MKKKILYVDMDGVIADFDKSIDEYVVKLNINPSDFEDRGKMVDHIVETNSGFFQNLEPIEGAIDSIIKLFELYDVYFLTSPMWWVPESFIGKRIWIEQHFGERAVKRLIITHRKDLNIGDYLIDDRLKNGAAEFTGTHIHFGTKEFPNWDITYKFLEKVVNF